MTTEAFSIRTEQDERIKEGIKAADAGQFVSDAEMDAIFDKYKDA